MKRLLLVALMVLVSLVWMVGFSRAGSEVSALQATINPTIGAVNKVLETGYDLDTVYDWEIVYELEKVYAWDSGYDLDTVYDWETVYALEKVYARDPASAKMYYLTVASFTGGDAIKACDPRFHMASISEIQDPSHLQYATRSTPAYDAPAYDQGFAPPPDHMGWVRTGSFPLTGVPDYLDFSMSSFDQQSSTTVSFHTPIWGGSYMDPFPSDPTTGWQMAQLSFSLPEPVWCVEDLE